MSTKSVPRHCEPVRTLVWQSVLLVPVCRPSPAQIKTHFSFRYLPEKRNGSWTPKRKGRLHAGFPLTSFEPVPADIRPFPKTGCNRGIGCRLCFRAETLRLALHGAGGNVLYRVTWFGVFFSDRGPCETLVGQRKTSDSCGHPAHRLSQRQPHSAPFSFLHRARRCLSFRASTEKKDRGAHYAANGLHTGKRKRLGPLVHDDEYRTLSTV